MSCLNCPRQCLKNKFCKAPDEFKINTHQLHYGEEPCISGARGSGAIFFSHCNLRCVYCQNYQISQLHYGRIYTDQEFVKICYELKDRGAHNINLVTPTCYHKRLAKILKKLRKDKFSLPIVWNSNGYERADNIRELKNLVDVYLPDFKYANNALALKYSQAPKYFEIAQKAILEMAKQQPENKLKDGVIEKGLIIRHLVLPNCLDNSKKVLKWINDNLGKDIWISLMSQYTPTYKSNLFPEINRALTKKEYKEICDYCFDLGFTNIYIQDLSSIGNDLIPSFNN